MSRYVTDRERLCEGRRVTVGKGGRAPFCHLDLRNVLLLIKLHGIGTHRANLGVTVSEPQVQAVLILIRYLHSKVAIGCHRG